LSAAATLPPVAARAAVFVDRDGTLIEDVPFNVDPQRVRFTRDAIEGLMLLQAFGYAIVMVTNQPDVGLGLFDAAALHALHADLQTRLAEHGVELAGVYACAHPPGAGCGCRKPEPGLLLRAASVLDIALERSWMIGDILDDVEAGSNAGCRTVLLDVGNETVWRDTPRRRPTLRAHTLFEAARAIIEQTTHYAAAAPKVPAAVSTTAAAATQPAVAVPL
jgi:D-glycero-D-manno-heptose 1,7-bisphosphate phosphatase